MTVRCPKCNASIKTEAGLKQHMTAKHSRFRCDPCKRRFFDQRALDDHNRSKHPEQQNEAVALCGGGAAVGGMPEKRFSAAVREFPGGAAQ